MAHRRKGLLAGTAATAAAVTGIIMGPVTALAQEEPPPVNSGKVSFSAGFDVVTEYWFRGLAQENQGLILQPYMDATFSLASRQDGLIQSVDAYIGTWNSLQDGPTGTGGGGTLHYELDFYAGIALGLMDKFGLDIGYVAYTSPNGAFSTTEEIDVTLSYDDSDLLGDFALSPTATLGFEIDGGADAGTKEGIYLGLGVEPSFKLVESEDYPITLSIPVTAGFSLDGDYYESTTGDDTFGYLDVGLVLAMPLSFIPAEYGSWEASVGVHAIWLGDETQNIAGRDFGVTGGDDLEVYGTFGLSMGY